MNKPVLILKNISREGPGLLEEVLREKGLPFFEVDLSTSEALPSLEDYRALIVLGGPDSANDENDKIHTELALIREALEREIPYLGICLGLQLLVKAMGGKVVPNPVKEIGFLDHQGQPYILELTEEGKKDPLFRDLEERLRVFHLHGETVELTLSMKLLGRGKHCENQVVKIGSHAYGLQCHFELTKTMFHLWLQEDADLAGLDQEFLRAEFQALEREYTQVGRRLMENFLKSAGI